MVTLGLQMISSVLMALGFSVLPALKLWLQVFGSPLLYDRMHGKMVLIQLLPPVQLNEFLTPKGLGWPCITGLLCENIIHLNHLLNIV